MSTDHFQDVEALLAHIKACTMSKDLDKGRRLHKTLTDTGRALNVFVSNSLINMYGKCGSMDEAYVTFTKMLQHTVVSWTSLILGYTENGQTLLALETFSRMQLEGCPPNSLTFVAALKACTGQYDSPTSFATRGIQISAQATAAGLSSDIYVASTLVDMHSKFGRMEDAKRIFDNTPNRTVVSWTVLMWGYVDNGQPGLGLALFFHMQLEGYVPDSQCFVAVAKACANLAKEDPGVRVTEERTVKVKSLLRGLSVHSQASSSGYDGNKYVASALVEMYTECGSVEDARRTFEKVHLPDVVLWNSIMLGYVETGENETALCFYESMLAEGCHPDDRSFVAALKACVGLLGGLNNLNSRALETVMAIHSQAMQTLRRLNPFMVSSLIDVYSKCGSLTDARRVFELHREPDDVVAWNTMMMGYVESQDGSSALELLQRLQEEGWCKPDCITYLAGLKASGIKASLQVAKLLHAEVARNGLEDGLGISSCLVDTYGKSGSHVDAELAFERVSVRDVVHWSALVAGYSTRGDSLKVVETFQLMQEEGLCPNEVTFLSVLKACNHAGLVEKGRKVLEEMLWRGRRPGMEHYHCMVDMVGRAYGAEEALGVVECMPLKANDVTWMTLLSVCSKWRNAACGRVAFERLMEGGARDLAAAYDLMARCS